MSAALRRLGRFAARRPWLVIGIWVAVAVTVVVAAGTVGRELEDRFDVPGLDSSEALALLQAGTSDAAGLTAQLVLQPATSDTGLTDDPATLEAVAELQRRAAALPDVLGTTDVAGALAAGADVAVGAGVLAPDGRTALLTLQYPVVEELDVTTLDDLLALGEQLRADLPLTVQMRGDLFFAFAEPETGVGEALGIVVALFVLLAAFGSVVAAGLPIGIALIGLTIGVSALSLVTYLVEIPSWAPQIGSMVGLGVGIDYALFLVTRHREQLHAGMEVVESIGLAVATAGQAVLFAGGTVVIAILGLGVAGVPFMTAAGIATSLIVLVMVVAAVTLLPALLGVVGTRIDRLHVGRRRTVAPGAELAPGWHRWGRHVTGHAAGYAVGVTVVLLALTAPVLSLQLGFPDDGSLPTSRTERRAYDLIADGFGAGSNGPLLIAVDLGDDPTDADGVATGLAAAVAADVGVAAVRGPFVDPATGVATIVATSTDGPQSTATTATIARLRAEVLPRALAGTSVTAHVGGQSATFADIAGRVSDRLPVFVAAVLLLSLLLLTMVFRAPLVALKAALLNLLSIGAAYGVLVMVFQWGWGKELLGLETTVPIVSFIPMFLFAIVFGLSMDYEVFLLSRVRETWLATGDNDHAVIEGIASTARVITSAALIMISVFGGFVLGSDPSTKMFGLGLATAIFVDATIVRLVLVPATMSLLGDRNWWLPGWLDRLLPTVDVEGTATPTPTPTTTPQRTPVGVG